jgi:hypothetical protein
LYDDTATRDIFLDGMSAGSLLAAKALANRFPWRDFGTVIDVGTAQGCVPVEIARLGGQWISKEIPGIEAQPMRQTVFVHVACKAPLEPLEAAQLGSPETVAVADQDHGCVPMAPAAALPGGGHQPLDFAPG